ncbi:MAG: prolipoprotein diacylglyceryl transferase [Lachnospiraceae bacterium]|nr:prolipoprotein diacylglyceryl transferase [Lachnospiraceae bacterium]
MTLKSGEIYFSSPGSSWVLPETISLFGLSISFYGVFLVLAALVGILAATREARRKKQNLEWNLTLITLVIVAALLGARLYYVLFRWQSFVEEPIALLNFRSGGLTYFGALFGAWLAVKWHCHYKNAEFEQNADTLCMGAAAAAPFIWTGCAFVREPIGRFYDGIFAVRIGAEYVPKEMEPIYSETLLTNARQIRENSFVSMHPVAFYGVVCSIIVLVVLCIYGHTERPDGAVFTMYLFLMSITNIILEFFRADRYCIWGTKVPVNFVVAGVILLIIIVGWVRPLLRSKNGK